MQLANFLRVPRDGSAFIRHEVDEGVELPNPHDRQHHRDPNSGASHSHNHNSHHEHDHPSRYYPHLYQHFRTHLSTANLPEALPCRHHCQHIPHRVEALGNVYITDEDELQRWRLIARRVTREEAERHGGCIIFTPFAHHREGSEGEKLYYCITDADDIVYGRATYRSQNSSSTNAIIYQGHRFVR